MTWLIIVLVLLLILGPAYALLPSPKQKRQMAMRREAMAEGIGVELTRIEDPDPDPDKHVSSTGKPLERVISVAAYRLNRRKADGWHRIQSVDWSLVKAGVKGEAKGDGYDLHLPAGWQWHGNVADEMSVGLKGFLCNRLGGLPADVIRVDEIKATLSVYWIESDDEDALGKVIDFLKECVLVDSRASEGNHSSEED